MGRSFGSWCLVKAKWRSGDKPVQALVFGGRTGRNGSPRLGYACQRPSSGLKVRGDFVAPQEAVWEGVSDQRVDGASAWRRELKLWSSEGKLCAELGFHGNTSTASL